MTTLFQVHVLFLRVRCVLNGKPVLATLEDCLGELLHPFSKAIAKLQPGSRIPLEVLMEASFSSNRALERLKLFKGPLEISQRVLDLFVILSKFLGDWLESELKGEASASDREQLTQMRSIFKRVQQEKIPVAVPTAPVPPPTVPVPPPTAPVPPLTAPVPPPTAPLLAVAVPQGDFLCVQCGRSFTSRGNLAIHSNVHKERVISVCPHCSRQYVRKCELNKHLERCAKRPRDEEETSEYPAAKRPRLEEIPLQVAKEVRGYRQDNGTLKFLIYWGDGEETWAPISDLVDGDFNTDGTICEALFNYLTNHSRPRAMFEKEVGKRL